MAKIIVNQCLNANEKVLTVHLILCRTNNFPRKTNMVWSSKMLWIQIWTACNYKWWNC